MKKSILLFIGFCVLCSHDMFLKLDTYFLQPNERAQIMLFNGTFEKSDNVIARDRMIDVSVVGNGTRTKIDTSQWSERDSMTILSLNTGAPGTYVAGVSTYARNIAMDADAFNGYLEHDGIIDMIESRKANNTMDQNAVEKYSKHVKTIYQVGDLSTNDWSTELGYPIEFIPLSNPYDLQIGDNLDVKLLRNGQPLTSQLVYADHAASAQSHSHTHDTEGHSHDEAHEHIEGEDHTHDGGVQLRTDDNGVVSVGIVSDGIWYLRTIDLITVQDTLLTHESNWATLTFEVAHIHGHDIASYVTWLGGLALLVILLLWLRKRGSK